MILAFKCKYFNCFTDNCGRTKGCRYNQQPHSMAPEVLSHHHSYYHLAFFQEDRLDSDRRLLHIQWHRQVRLFTVYVKQQSSII